MHPWVRSTISRDPLQEFFAAFVKACRTSLFTTRGVASVATPGFEGVLVFPALADLRRANAMARASLLS